jgi:hypothetical protein
MINVILNVCNSKNLLKVKLCLYCEGIFLYLAQRLPVGQDLLIFDVSKSHITTHHSL